MATKKTDTEAAPAEETKTEKEKAGSGGPAGAAKEPEKAKPVETGATDPYPTGSPPDPEAGFEAAHGFKRAKE